jgi:predicted nuclease with TOPRIM domain
MKYENRVVAFIDILGFKNMLDETVNKKDEDLEENIDKLIAAYNEINELWKEDRNDNSKLNSSRKVTIFSDSIVVSFEVY